MIVVVGSTIDTTGAGDAFAGAFAAALAEDRDFTAAFRFGTVAGSLACTRRGAQPSIPTRAEMEATLDGAARRRGVGQPQSRRPCFLHAGNGTGSGLS